LVCINPEGELRSGVPLFYLSKDFAMAALMTKLDAVNKMLESVWETPVSSLEVAGVGSVAMAKRILDEQSTNVQNEGWTFNTEDRVLLTPDINGEISLPSNTLEVDTVDEDADTDVVQRGTRLYNRGDHTFIFTKALYVRLKLLLDFEDMPQVVRSYVAIMASRVFKSKYENSEAGAATAEEVQALSNLRESEGQTGDFNMFTGSWSVANILER
jgi:hypothetical protein